MKRLLVAVVVFMAACGNRPHPTAMGELAFLTRGECVNTPRMRANLDAALRALALPLDYVVIDLDTLPRRDVRSGYPTPTLLYENRDVFGMPEPTPPLPEPT